MKLGSVERYALIQGKDKIADKFTKTGSKRTELDEIMMEGRFRVWQ